MVKQRWSDEETLRLQQLVESGADQQSISRELGRSERAVRHRISWLTMTPEQKQRQANYERNRRRNQNKTSSKDAGIKFNDYRAVVPSAVLAEREHRINLEYRSITAAVFGDPPIGYSALERLA